MPWSPEYLRARAQHYAGQFDVPWSIGKALVGQESDWNPYAVSPKNAQGLMQIIPATQEYLGITDPWDPEQSYRGGFQYLAEQYKKFGSWPLALAAYNAGPQRVIDAGYRIPRIKETQDYVANIMRNAGMSPDDAALPPTSTPGGLPPTMGAVPLDLEQTYKIDLSPIPQQEPTLTSRLASNPFLMMGLGILGNRGNIGKGMASGLQLAQQAESREARRVQNLMMMEQRRRDNQLFLQQNLNALMNTMGGRQGSPYEIGGLRARMKQHTFVDETGAPRIVSQDPISGEFKDQFGVVVTPEMMSGWREAKGTGSVAATIGRIDPGDWTPESLQTFSQTQNYTDLVPREGVDPLTATERKAEIASQGAEADLRLLDTLTAEGVNLSGLSGLAKEWLSQPTVGAGAVRAVLPESVTGLDSRHRSALEAVRRLENTLLAAARGAQVGPREQEMFRRQLPIPGLPDFRENLLYTRQNKQLVENLIAEKEGRPYPHPQGPKSFEDLQRMRRLSTSGGFETPPSEPGERTTPEGVIYRPKQ